MFALISEDYHESNQKGKPRSPKSQGVTLNSNHISHHSSSSIATTTTFSDLGSTASAATPRSFTPLSTSNLSLNLSDNLVISNGNDDLTNSGTRVTSGSGISSESTKPLNPNSSIDNFDIINGNLSRSKAPYSLIHTSDNHKHYTTKEKNISVANTATTNNETIEKNINDIRSHSIVDVSSGTSTSTVINVEDSSVPSTSAANPAAAGALSHRRNTDTSITSLESSFSIPSNLNISIEKATVKDYKRVAKTLVLSFEDDPFMNFILNTANITKQNTPKSAYKKKKLDLMQAYFEYDAYECIVLGGTILIIKDNNLEQSLDDLGVKKDKFPYLGCALWNQIYGSNVDSSGSSGSDTDDDDYFDPGSLTFRDNFHPSYVKFNVHTILRHCRSKILKDKLPFLYKVRKDVLIKQLIKKQSITQNNTMDIWYLNDISTLPSMRGKGLGKLLIEYAINKFTSENPNTYCYLESSNPANRKFYTKLGFKVMTSFSIKNNKIVNSEKIQQIDPKNEGINMDSMVYFPSIASKSSCT
ncbi:uncharacterized protein RJT21DRAFT_119068 [Scheffersomyces amazonensis]|uniref:uncharacterized protein n=1 Tax=Scheffersomyces amazonensis TaxID=1078765 RepID=UPI00315CCFC2